jgi:hypothetical protein
MKVQTSAVRNSLFLGAALLALPSFRLAAQTKPDNTTAAQAATIPARITQAIDETQLVRLQGNVHPFARPEFDRGAAPPNLPMDRILLVLKRSPEQEAALDQFMTEQHDKSSPNFHKWLTPVQFGAQYGPADADIQTVTSWLQSHGFQVARVTNGKTAVEFSGTAALLKEAFRTEIHSYMVDGEQHWANANDPQIPAALSPVVHGFASLHNFRPKPMHHVTGEFSRSKVTGEVLSANPQFTTSGGNFALGPTDFATIYNVLPLWNAATPIDGAGQNIAVLGVSNINLQDVRDFRTLFGLPAKDPNIVIDGSDPGIINDGSETEALLDVEWSGAVARGAQVDFVIAADTNLANGLILAALHVIDFNLDPIMSISFGNCELNLGTNGNRALNLLWQQAAAQGITVAVASGDPGSAGCENQNAAAPNPATTGLQVSGFASTPFNVAVGGTDFNDAGTQSTYFKPNSQNDPNTLASALGYIPESTWNDSCTNAAFGSNAETNCNAAGNSAAVITIAGSGGKSHCTTPSGTTPASCSGGYAKPPFQSLLGLTGMPADGKRDIPDVSLFASDGFNKSFYVVCEADKITSGVSCNKSGAFHFLAVGGTSASTPAFAGIMALVNQGQASGPNPTPRQGNANFVLYQLAKMQYAAGTACNSVASPLPAAACTFNDVTTGTIAMPCTKGSTDCTTSVATDKYGVLSGFSTNAGYDLATGLGSVNVKNLVTNWGTGLAALTNSTTTLTLYNGTAVNIVHGAAVAVQITVSGAGGTPTGHVALVSTATTGQGVDGFDLVNGTLPAGTTTNQLTGSSPAGQSYQVHAHYPGDGTFGPSDSLPVSVIVSPQGSLTVASIFASQNGATFAPGAYPQTAFLRADVTDSGNLGKWTATGTVDFADNTTTTLASKVGVSTDSAAFTGPVLLSGGAHSIVAKYSGDPSFNASNSAALPTFSITPAVSTTTGAGPATVAAGQNATLTATVQTQALAPAAAPSATITFKNGSTTIGAPVTVNGVAGGATGASATASLNTTFNSAGTQTITAVYSGDTNYAGSTSASFTVSVTSQGSFAIGGSAVTVTAGSTGTSTITVTPSGGFTGTVNVTCPVAGLPVGVTCSPNPLAISVPGTAAVTGQLTVAVAAPSTTLTASAAPAARMLYAAGTAPGRGKGWWTLSAGTGLVAVFLLFLPGRKRYRAALGLGLVCVLSFTLGCSSGYGGGGGGGGPVATTTKITVNSAKLASSDLTGFRFTISVTASVGANGQVQLFDGTTTLGAPVTVSNGTATIMSAGLLPGTHSISAHYLGDTYTQASNSGTLNVTSTGTTTFAITATPAASNGSPTVNITIN